MEIDAEKGIESESEVKTGTVMIHGIPKHINKSLIFDALVTCGVKPVSIVYPSKYMKRNENGCSAMVIFNSIDDANKISEQKYIILEDNKKCNIYIGRPSRYNVRLTKTLCIDNINYKIDEEMLAEFMGKKGLSIKNVRLRHIPNNKLKINGFGWIYFDTIDEAKKAMNVLHGMELLGDKLYCEYSSFDGRDKEINGGNIKRSKNIMVRNIHWKGTSDVVKDILREKCGENILNYVVSVYIYTDKRGFPIGNGKIKLKNVGAAVKIMKELNGIEWNNETFRVEYMKSYDNDDQQERVIKVQKQNKKIENGGIAVKKKRKTWKLKRRIVKKRR